MTAKASAGTASTQRLALIAPAVLVIALVIIELHDSAAAIVGTWYELRTFNHGFLIVPICLYLAWRKRDEAASITPAPNAWGMAAVAIASLLWLAGHATATVVVEEISLVSIIEAAVLAIYGWPTWRLFAFPLLYLYFAVPVGEIFVPQLQTVTADFAVGLLRISGIPVFADGNVISIPTGSWYVAEACSGVRFLIASIALGTLFAGVNFRSWWRRACFLGLSVGVPVIANGLRVYAIIVIAYLADNESAAGFDHVVFGWVFFSIVTVILLAIGKMMGEPSAAEPVGARAEPAPGQIHQPIPRALLAIVLTLAPVFAVRAYSDHIDQPQIVQPVRLVAPELAAAWRNAAGARDPLTPEFAAPSAQIDATYDGDGARVYLHIGYYVREQRGAQAVGFGHVLVPAKGWTPSATGRTSAVLGDDKITVQVVREVSGRETRLIWYWYWVDGRFTGESLRRETAAGQGQTVRRSKVGRDNRRRHRLQREPARSGEIAVGVSVGSGRAEADARRRRPTLILREHKLIKTRGRLVPPEGRLGRGKKAA